jgi:hypothetical protein
MPLVEPLNRPSSLSSLIWSMRNPGWWAARSVRCHYTEPIVARKCEARHALLKTDVLNARFSMAPMSLIGPRLPRSGRPAWVRLLN